MKVSYLIFMLIINYSNCAVFTKDEQIKCKNIIPKNKDDCLKQDFESLNCCYFEMESPHKGIICLPLPSSSRQNLEIKNQMLFEKINFNGMLYCEGGFRSMGLYVIIIIIIMLY
jgi:hypothetical protein